ncbi:hypothetical protein [Montanilutibacter psychrotolerans]|uniref:Uncharacterized protein n=1 Tax=Montanilutibacter psychrotolerans TaxID=1327343 RepID=A0A3M8SZT8_9GAMM|nr:hypothetical protein [Lysobacter psychrotolerans]RNF84946.1 hypothetical protein EER27_03910 [Lysobacter psychrotolerans]
MLSLDSSRWGELQHAYGPALDTPSLLRQLQSLPEAAGESEPWFTLWSSLAHQGDVYSASFAAVPHVVSALASQPEQAGSTYFQFPAWVEICRKHQGMSVPADLEQAYFAALSQLPALAAAAASRPWDGDMVACVLAAIAAVKGDATVAEAALALSPDGAASYLGWLADQ